MTDFSSSKCITETYFSKPLEITKIMLNRYAGEKKKQSHVYLVSCEVGN